MNFRFAERIEALKPSLIREILKAEPDPEMVVFAAGNPDPATFPIAEMQAAADSIFAEPSSFQYGITEGYTPLRRTTAERIRSRFSIGRDFDDTIVVSGGQQGIDLTARVLLNEGESVICEQPSFIGALNCFRAQRLSLIPVGCDFGGMDMDALEAALAANPHARLIYTIPDFQNPGGTSLALERRSRMLELAEKYNVYILEDSPYFELRYSGNMLPTLKSMDDTGRVIYCGSYSKTVAPGLRIGYVTAHKEIIAKLAVAKQTTDVHTSLFFQRVVDTLVSGGGFEAHLDRCRALYGAKCRLMLNELGKHVRPEKARWSRPEGGLFIWVELPEGFDGTELCLRAKAKKVTCVPGVAFNVDEAAPSRGLRLNFSLPNEEQIVRGIGVLGEVIDDYVR